MGLCYLHPLRPFFPNKPDRLLLSFARPEPSAPLKGALPAPLPFSLLIALFDTESMSFPETPPVLKGIVMWRGKNLCAEPGIEKIERSISGQEHRFEVDLKRHPHFFQPTRNSPRCKIV
jgi:hypothetical protein